MAQQEEIVLWIDQRWKNAIEKHLKDETLQEHLENALDELCNQLPEREYERISRAIQSEAAAQRAAEEVARTYAAYHVTENGQESSTVYSTILSVSRFLNFFSIISKSFLFVFDMPPVPDGVLLVIARINVEIHPESFSPAAAFSAAVRFSG